MCVERAGDGAGGGYEPDLSDALCPVAADRVRNLDQDHVDGRCLGGAEDAEVTQEERVRLAVGTGKIL
jgi:hypothetical protein